ncbi:MAG TPA: aminoglycoside phosphotransferase family protein [Chthonomonadaceae bacterium]|nr:aminoglycoside phosphotransferase family protein [Chthonomonadaceae bacterium]
MTNIPLVLPDRFVRTIHESFQERGAPWLDGLSARLAAYADRWSLTILAPFPNLSFNYVTPVLRADGTEAVLKVGVPNRELNTEISALRVYDGRGSVQLLESDQEQGVMLLERLKPGNVLTALASEERDEEATSIAADVMRKLWQPAPQDHPFPTVADWADGMQRLRSHFNGGVGPFPLALVEEAETLFAELLGSMSAPVLLHGDLHHDNILSAERQPWLAIDPKGIVGEPAYEVGAMLRNLWEDRHPISHPDRLLERRIIQLSEELDLDRSRVRGWAVAQSVLSAWWCMEDNSDCWKDAIVTTELLATVKA